MQIAEDDDAPPPPERIAPPVDHQNEDASAAPAPPSCVPVMMTQVTMERQRIFQSPSDGLASVGRAEPCLSADFFNQELRFHARRLLEDDHGGLETFRSTDPRVIEKIVELMDRYKRSRKEVIGRLKRLITKRRHSLKQKREKENQAQPVIGAGKGIGIQAIAGSTPRVRELTYRSGIKKTTKRKVPLPSAHGIDSFFQVTLLFRFYCICSLVGLHSFSCCPSSCSLDLSHL
jgi:hypothetical protein